MKRLVSNALWTGLKRIVDASTDLCANYSRLLKHIYRLIFSRSHREFSTLQ